MKFTKTRTFAHILMVLLVFDWGFEYICAKHAMDTLPVINLIFFKYCIGILVVLGIKFKIDRKARFKAKDLWILVVCALTGDILYYACEYKAMDYMPISLITIMLALVPAGSILVERVVYKKKASAKIIIGLTGCVIGVGMIIGADFSVLFEGRILGYILSLGAITAWNTFNFLTAKLTDRYSGITLTMNQLLCTICLTFPYAIGHWPAMEQMTPGVITGLLYMGIVSAGLGFYIYVYSLGILGPTTNAIYSNFLPLSATIFGWMFYGEMISTVQIIGGIVVISTGYMVIREKGKLESLEH